MTETSQTPPYTLEMDDKVAQVMAYSANGLYWGEVVVKTLIRVSTWLRTNSAPERVCIYNAKMMNTTSGMKMQPMHFTELYIATSQVNIFHLLPPAKDPLDYDPSEPNRRMQPISILISNFRIDGLMRLAASTTVAKALEVSREGFISIYDAQISSPINPSFGKISTPYVLVRREIGVFTIP